MKHSAANAVFPVPVKAPTSGATTRVINNGPDRLFTTFYPNKGRQTVILLHGGPGFPDDLLQVVLLLKEAYQVITFHQRGTRRSPCTTKDYSMEAYLSDIEAVRKFYGIDRFHLWGHSWGGLYAQVYAEKHFKNLLSLFLCCPGSGTNREWTQTEKEVMQLNRSKCTFWQWTNMGISNLLGMLGSSAGYCRLFRQVMKNYNDDFINTEAIETSFPDLRAEPINKTRPQIVKYKLLVRQEAPPCKITIVYGDQDIYQSSKNFVLRRYPKANVTTIDNCGHIPWLHNPEGYKKVSEDHYGSLAPAIIV